MGRLSYRKRTSDGSGSYAGGNSGPWCSRNVHLRDSLYFRFSRQCNICFVSASNLAILQVEAVEADELPFAFTFGFKSIWIRQKFWLLVLLLLLFLFLFSLSLLNFSRLFLCLLSLRISSFAGGRAGKFVVVSCDVETERVMLDSSFIVSSSFIVGSTFIEWIGCTGGVLEDDLPITSE